MSETSEKPEEAAINGVENHNHVSSSSENELEDLDCLNFPGDVDWSSTVVLRCDPSGGPYNLSEVLTALHEVVRRNEVHNLGPTFLNHAFTLSFKTVFALENFIRYMQSPKMSSGLKVRGKSCTVSRIPPKCVAVSVRNIPLEIDSAAVIDELRQYGTVVKTELVRSNFRGWFHVYTSERKVWLQLKKDVKPEDLPFGIEVKGLFASVSVAERNPKCLECYYSGHKNDTCENKGCILYTK